MNIRGTRRAASVIVCVLFVGMLAGALTAAPVQAATKPIAHGVVKAAVGAQPLGGIKVCAVHRDARGGSGAERCTTTAADGTWSLTLYKGLFSFRAEETGLYGDWLAQRYQGNNVYSFGPTSNRTINFAMVRGAKISGFVHAPDGGPRIDYTHVTAFRLNSAGRYSRVTFSNVGENGYYEVSKLPPGRYKLQVDDGYGPAGYRNQWYPAAGAASGAEVLVVTTGQNVSGTDISLTLPGSLKINLRKPDGSAARGQVEVFDADGRAVWQHLSGDPSTWKITGLHPGTYKIRTLSRDVVGYTQWYTGKRSFATANSITVASGAVSERTVTFRYRKIKATSRPKLKQGDSDLIASKGTWSPRPSHYRYDWIRDGKVVRRETSADWYVTGRADYGHRIKVCVRAQRNGYQSGRSCSGYSGTIKR